MGLVVRRDLARLATQPRIALEGIMAGQAWGASILLGAAGYYWRTLQVSELLFGPALGRPGYLVGNALVALAWMGLLVTLVHVACRLLGRARGRWLDLFLLWGYTQLPAVILTVLSMAVLAPLPQAWGTRPTPAETVLAVAIVLCLSLWGLVLKFKAVQVCYDLSGRRLWSAVALALALHLVVSRAEFMFISERGFVPKQAIQAMAPTVGPSPALRDRVFLPFDKLTYHLRPPRRGETVGFVPPGESEFPSRLLRARMRFIGRVIGLPGDEVEVRSGRVYLNGRPSNEPYRLGGLQHSIPLTKVPEGHYFLLGDNRDRPVAEYHGGLVPERRVRGRLTEVGQLRWKFLVGKGQW